MIKFILNNSLVETQCSPGTVLLDLIREDFRLTGTKEGCREGECGACTILLGALAEDGNMKYKACASCLLPIGEVKNKHVVTVEGLNMEDGLNAVQQAIFDNSASQCGFCTPGIVLSLTGFLLTSKDFNYNDAVTALDGNICRCTGYVAIRNAAKQLSNKFSKKGFSAGLRIIQLVETSVLPKYFLDINRRLTELQDEILIKPEKDDPVYVGGGTDLFVQKSDVLEDSELEFISEHSSLSKIEIKDGVISIGGGVTTEDLRNSDIINKYFPQLKNDLLLISSTIMRNRATIAGNIVNASPIGDIAIIMLALNASLIIRNIKTSKRRKLAVNKFFNAYKIIDLKKNEIIESFTLSIPSGKSCFNFEKVSNRKHLDIASCNSAVSFELDNKVIKNIQISAGGVAPVPMILDKTCQYLEGKEVSSNILEEAGKILLDEISPIDDIRGSAKYKKLLMKQLFLAHFLKLTPKLIEAEEVV